MRRQLRAELLKLLSARTSWALAAAAVGLVVVITVLTLALSPASDLQTEQDVRSVLSVSGVAALFLLILGVVFSAGEYRHGTIAWTLLVTPDRLRVMAAQALACAAVGVAVGLVVASLAAAISLPWLDAREAPTLSTGQVLGASTGGVLYTALAASLGAGVGALLRNQVVAIVLVLVVLFVIDPTVTALAGGYDKYSLSGLGTAITGGPAEDVGADDLLPMWVAALIWVAYTAVLVGAAAVMTSRRDV